MCKQFTELPFAAVVVLALLQLLRFIGVLSPVLHCLQMGSVIFAPMKLK